MTSFCFFVQLADRTLILKQKEFFVFMIASRLFLNHSPSEWFSFIQKWRAHQDALVNSSINPENSEKQIRRSFSVSMLF